MNLPEAIQRQVEEAEALERELYAQPEQSDEPQPAAEVTQATEQLPATDQESTSESKQDERVQQPQIKAKPGREDDPSYWRDRANALYGMNQHQAEELRQLRAQMQEVTGEIARLRQEQRPVEQPVKDNDAETFGEDLVDTIDRRAEQKAKRLVEQQMAEVSAYIRQLEAKLGSVNDQVTVSAQDRFYRALGGAVPDYAAINADQGFLTWLGEVDPIYGATRQAALDAAANALDASRVANVFNAYKALSGRAATDQQKQQVRKELERQTAPVSTKGNAQAGQQGKTYTQEEYTAALDPRNVSRMGKQAADALAADAEAAFYEGRVRF